MSRMQGKTSSTQPTTPPVYVGIDASKSHLDVYIHPAGIARRVTNDKSGLKALTALLHSHAPEVIVVEATGRYHGPFHRHLHAAGFCVAVMNPFRTRKFADMMGQLAKTDEIDARTLALFGAMVTIVKPETTPPPTQQVAQLAELLTARRQVGTEMMTLKSSGNRNTCLDPTAPGTPTPV